jgi:amino acid permease
MTSIAGLITWFGIGFTYIRFYAGMKAQGIDRRTLPYWTRFQPFAAYYTCISTMIICIVCLPACTVPDRVELTHAATVQWMGRLP